VESIRRNLKVEGDFEVDEAKYLEYGFALHRILQSPILSSSKGELASSQ
ncbi:hypothetical protein Tco_1171935, partial [Tanacetum coccineum]